MFLPYVQGSSKIISEHKFIERKQINFEKGDYILELDIQPEQGAILDKIELASKPLSTFGRAYFGIQTFDRKKYVVDEKFNGKYFPVVDGGNVNRYSCRPHKEYVLFEKNAIKSGGNLDVYSQERIVVRQIGKFPEGTIIPSNLFTLNTIYNIFLHRIDSLFLHFLLGLINSKLLQFYWYIKHFDNKSTFPKIKKAPLESLPINSSKNEVITEISSEVSEILNRKKEDPTGDTRALEAEIDRLVYELYGLTEEEIQIVEESMG